MRMTIIPADQVVQQGKWQQACRGVQIFQKYGFTMTEEEQEIIDGSSALYNSEV